MTKDAYLRHLRETGRESVRFFSNQYKPERERCVVRAFLRVLGVSFKESDLLIGQPEPVDVAALAAKFQVTEVLDQDRKRQDEYARRLGHWESLESDADLREPWTNPRPVRCVEAMNAVSTRLSRKIPQRGVDALVYFNRRGTFLDVTSAVPDASQLSRLAWRSVSMVFVPFAVVFCAAPDAPPYIRNAVGVVQNRWPKADGWFEPDAT